VATEAVLEALELIYERWSEGDFRAGQEMLGDDVVFVVDDPTLGQRTYRGRDEVARYLREFVSSWSHVRHVAEEFVDYGDRVFVTARQIGMGNVSGAEVDDEVFAVWTFRGDKVIRLEHLRDRGAAAAAAESRS
jgi:ketosteroid isomerase-like protein